MSELLRIRAGDSDFSVTVGRSTAGFVYGTRSLPDDIDGIPAFIMDSTPLLVNQMEGRVEKDSSQVFTYGGSDGRDLLSRSEMIPKGQFSFTRSDLSVTRNEEDHEDGTTTLTTTKDFDVAGTVRRVTGDVHVSVELGQDSLGTIIPGVDVRVGEHILLEVWGQTLELVVSSYRHSSTGWMMTVESVVQAPTLSKTNEMVQRWRTPSERIEQLSKEVRDIKADYESDSVISSGGGEPGPPGPTEPSGPPEMHYQRYSNGQIYGSGPMESVSDDNSDGYNFLNILFKESSPLTETSGILFLDVEALELDSDLAPSGEGRKLSGTWNLINSNGFFFFDYGSEWVRNGDFEIKCFSDSTGTREVVIRSHSSATGESGFQRNTYVSASYIPTDFVY